MTDLPPWRPPLKRALHRNRSLAHLKFVQLATVDASGKPHNRTIVFRGLTDRSHQLAFVTDARSEKFNHLAHQPWVEVCWYFTKTREQFRLSGMMQALSAHSEDPQLRQTYWSRLSDKAQQQFYWPHPGHERDDENAFDLASGSVEPPQDFVLLLLSPEKVDHLELRGSPQNRTLYEKADPWKTTAVNP